MLKIFIQGIKDGATDVHLTCNAEQMPFFVDEFFGIVELNGKLRKIGQRFIFSGQAKATARLECDLSLEIFEQEVVADINIIAVMNSDYTRLRSKVRDDTNEIALNADGKYIDLTGDVRQLLELNLPMKRIHPKYQDMTLEDIFPEYSANNKKNIEDSSVSDESNPWLRLKNLPLDNNN